MYSGETKERILDEALKLFMKNGYEKTSLDNIAQKINITKPALYYYYKNKDELFLEVSDVFLSILSKTLRELMESTDNIKQFLKNTFYSLNIIIKNYQTIVSDIEDDTVLLRSYFFIYEAMKKIPGFRKKIFSIYDESAKKAHKLFLEAKYTGLIRDDLDYKTMSYELSALVEGLFVMNIINPENDIDETGKRVFDNYWKRLKK